jgi:hypothetical protein
MNVHENRPRAEETAEHPPQMHGDDSAAEQADVIEANSPEGRPGDPRLRGGGMFKWMLLIVAGVVIVAVVLAVTQGIIAGLFALVLGLCLGIIANSEVWAAASRAKERHDLDKHASHAPNHK